MDQAEIRELLKTFGLSASGVRKPPDAMLASVYIVDDRWLLRSRDATDDTPRMFEAERERTAAASSLTGCRFPEYLRSRDGEAYVVRDGLFWTVHRLIPGRPLGSWTELHRVPPRADRQVMTALRRLHQSTRGRFAEEKLARAFFVDRIEPQLEEAPSFLPGPAVRALRAAFERVRAFTARYPAAEACFVHGDFHHGNVLTNEGAVSGFIDLDWCRIAHPLEDLGFTVMMLLRDSDTWSPAFRPRRYRELVSLYGPDGDTSCLDDYILLYGLFDCHCFRTARFERAEDFHTYQKMFVRSLSGALGNHRG